MAVKTAAILSTVDMSVIINASVELAPVETRLVATERLNWKRFSLGVLRLHAITHCTSAESGDPVLR